ncbi:MAG: hypothetical protein K8U57_04380 [Planctomycetes bacterium]|nr:hypothetical protein [Planctomycetota bacterium]
MRLDKRLGKVEQAMRARLPSNQFSVVQAIPIANAGGRSLGLHRVGIKGSTGGVFVYDPAQGRAQLPDEERTRGAFVVVCEPALFEPGRDYVGEWGI